MVRTASCCIQFSKQEESTIDTKRTPLYSRHLKHGARMIQFGGWSMPVQFASTQAEHAAVREHAGLFDIGHMGVVTVRGTRAMEFLQIALTNNVERLRRTGKILYTCMCRQDGGILDDLLVYENFEEGLLLVLNAATTTNDLNWLWWLADDLGYDPTEVSIAHRTDLSMIALQGPKATEMLQRFVSCDLTHLRYYNGMSVRLRGQTLTCGKGPALLSRTGYTGEDGIEVIAPADMIATLWDQLTEAGAVHCGLAARDILRLEMGYSLYGKDITVETTPLEANLGWLVSFKKPDSFIGREALEKQKAEGVTRKLVGIELDGKGIPRADYPILLDGKPIGHITSGTMSSRLGHGIGLGYVPTDVADARPPLAVQIRNRAVEAHIEDLPFYHPSKPAVANAASNA